MTFGQKLSHVARDDPNFARSVRRIRFASWIFGLAVVVALAFGVWAVLVNGQQANQITRIESPCLRYGAKSERCKEAYEQATLTITHAEACAIERKAGTLAAIRALARSLRRIGIDISFSEPCAGARLRQERRRGRERAATRAAEGGDALQTPHHSAHQQPGPREGGQPETTEPPTPPTGAGTGLPEDVTQAVEGAGSTVKHTVEGVLGR